MAMKNFMIKKQMFTYNSTSVVDLIRRSKLEEKKGKRRTFLIAVASVSAFVISGYIIAQ